MKIAVCSDLHLEFGPIVLENTQDAKVIILSGDICVADDLRNSDSLGFVSTAHASRLCDLIDSCVRSFDHVVYIMGNHEHYHGDYATTASVIRKFIEDRWGTDQVHFLDKESIKIDDVTFVGGTLWTNFDVGDGPGDSSAMRSISGMMNDYRGVSNSAREVEYKIPVYATDENGDHIMKKVGEVSSLIVDHYDRVMRSARFSPEDAYEDHLACMEFIKNTVDADPLGKFVVVGHHAPSKQSTHPRYKNETLINSAYSSDLTEFMLARPQIKVWTHGHTHEPFDYMVGSTRIVCNPRGYDGYESRADQFELKYVEL